MIAVLRTQPVSRSQGARGRWQLKMRRWLDKTDGQNRSTLLARFSSACTISWPLPSFPSVFQKKASQADSETLYSLPSKQSRGQDSDSSTYDTLVPSQPPGLDELIRLQEQVKRGSLSVDEALERFGDWQWVQRGKPGAQQDKLQQLRADITSSNADDDSVYDKINIVHHTTSVPTEDCRRRNQPAEGDFYSKPVKAQHSRVFKKVDKQ